MSQPHLSNSKFVLKEPIENHAPIQMSAWLVVPTEWPEGQRFPNPPSAFEQEAIDKAAQLLADHNIQVQINVKSITSEDASQWPTVARLRLFPNTGREAPKAAAKLDDDIPF
tara:strand:+ start:203 stop:538 length:336 start_codon:yes stop_codon:yes gene_type:complete